MDAITYASGELTACGLARLSAEVDKLNRRSRRLGLDPLTIAVVGERVETIKTTSGIELHRPLYTVEVRGVVPRINGWAVVGRITFLPAGNLVEHPPGHDLALKYRTMGNHCEHCHTQRRRNDLIVIRHEDGREIAVGRNCLADFIRTGDAESLLEAAGWTTALVTAIGGDDDAYMAGGGYRQTTERLQTLLEASAVCIRKLGWTPSQSDHPTKSDVSNLLYGWRWDRRAHAQWVEKFGLYITDQDRKQAADAITWLQGLQPSGDYQWNLHVLAQTPEAAPLDKLGLICSAVVAYARHCEQEIERKAREERHPRGFFGEAGKRYKGVEATVIRTRSIETAYGVSTLIVFETPEGTLTWFASGDRSDFEIGETHKIDFTVKEHEEHEKYGRTTKVTRVTSKAKLAA